MRPSFQSWGRYPKAEHQVCQLEWLTDRIPQLGEGQSLLPYGLGRSYGDSCLNDGQTLLATWRLNRFIEFEAATGRLRAEAGVSLADILAIAAPRGWFLPVTPGTKHVTLGGAIANDVHGKSHHVSGSFGNHVDRFELLRSDGRRLLCSPEENADYFAATVGGLGLTGLITWVELRLKRVPGPWIDVEELQFRGLDEFLALSRESEQTHEYIVAWVDCASKGKNLARGIFSRGNHSQSKAPWVRPKPGPRLPVDLPGFALNPLSVGLFNSLYFHKQFSPRKARTVSYEPFFYPLDAIEDWNRAYGKQGFLQWQCVVPFENARDAMKEILTRISASGLASFLSVMKTMGAMPPVGMLSFPAPGVTLALDFPARHARLFPMLEELDEIVAEAGGRLYPAKDARMSGRHFRLFYPRHEEFKKYIDPAFSSSFWRRVMSA